MSDKSKIYVWDWRGYVIHYAPNIAPLKHLLLTLSCYMDSVGGSCFPSIDTLVKVTSMSRPTILKYLKKAKKTGWIEVDKHGYSGQKWARNQYSAKVPIGVIKKMKELNDTDGKIVKEFKHVNEKVVKELNHVDEKAVNLLNEGGKNDSERRLTSLDSISSVPLQDFSNKREGTRLNGVLVPAPLDKAEIIQAYRAYCDYLKEGFGRWSNLTTTQIDLQKLRELQESGNEPVKVIHQSIHKRWKGFFELNNSKNNKSNIQSSDWDQQHLKNRAYQEL